MRMTDETFTIRAYGKSELAMMYFPNSSSKRSALRKLQHWISINPRLSVLIGSSGNYFTPKEVQLIVNEVGEPF
jgi:hypothetical protein